MKTHPVNPPETVFPRIVEPEWLDELSPNTPEARRSRRDLVRVNWFMRNPAILARALAKQLPPPGWCLVELGAGDGALTWALVRRLRKDQRPGKVILVDRLPALNGQIVARLAALGCEVEAAQADVFDWLETSVLPRSPVVIMANLFLHHFQDEPLKMLFELISRRANFFVACEPHRSRFAVMFAGPLLGWIGCNHITRHDGVLSVRAGFRDEELSALWCKRKGWDLDERGAGLFSHLFCAQRLGVRFKH
jgi:hypothetical protein